MVNYYYSMRKLKCIKTAFLEDIYHENDRIEQTWFMYIQLTTIVWNMVRQTRIYSKLWGYSILWGAKKIIFFPIPEIPKYSTTYFHTMSMYCMYIYKGAILTSATVPWHGLIFLPRPESQYIYWAPWKKDPLNPLESPKRHWLFLPPIGANVYFYITAIFFRKILVAK